MTFALDIRGLAKSFDRPAVAGLDLSVRQGGFYSLLGPNGAGKTTTLRMVAGPLPPGPRTIPIPGLDAGSARQVKRVLRERVAAGGTVIMTTHILEVAERMADRVGIIAGGRLIAEGTLDELRAQAGQKLSSLEDTFLALVAEQQAA